MKDKRIEEIAEEEVATWNIDIDQFTDDDGEHYFFPRDCGDAAADAVNFDELTLLTDDERGEIEDDDELADQIRAAMATEYKQRLKNAALNSLSVEDTEIYQYEDYYDPWGSGDITLAREFTGFPSDAVEVAKWDNQSPSCLSRSDYHYVELTLYFFRDNFHVVEDSYQTHPVQNCDVRTEHIVGHDDVELTDEWDVRNDAFWEKAKEVYHYAETGSKAEAIADAE